MIKKTKSSCWKRITALAVIPAFGLFFWVSAKPIYQIEDTSSNLNVETESTQKKPNDISKALVVIDGIEATQDDMAALSPNQISSVKVLKDNSAVAKYGYKGRNGVIEVTTEK